jgi:protein TonB
MRLASAVLLSASLHGAVAAVAWLAIDGRPLRPPAPLPVAVEVVIATAPDMAAAEAPADDARTLDAAAPSAAPPLAAAAEPASAAAPAPAAGGIVAAAEPATPSPRVEALLPRPAPPRPKTVSHPVETARDDATRPSAEPAAAAAPTAGTTTAAALGPVPRIAALPSTPARVGTGAHGNPPPVYPEEARQRGEEGRVVLHVMVAADGRAISVTVKASSRSRLLDDEAVRTVRHWQFEPATVEGVAVEGSLDVPIAFRLVD